ncbi:MAG: tRNA (guanosine(37)-N1)-methyltransferase TrmD [Pirellulales bacterium]|jgi:tRNA (guanine37-N1)-methyltransferase
MQFDILTLFPEIFSSYVSQSILSKAIESGLVQIDLHDIRNWTLDKHQRVDDRPYGGGPGMVMQVEPVVECVEAIQKTGEISGHLIMLTPTGKPLNQRLVEELVQRPRHILLCGRYEGFDQRVVDILNPLEISIGDYILNGGEVGAMALIDSMIRLVPGVLGDEQSSQDDSFSTGNRLLEFPHYTRPRDFRGHSVPEVLLSGDHGAIAQWRQEQSLQRTRERREDLL